MRRKDRQRDEVFAWEVLKTAPYGVVAVLTPDGAPYCVPVNLAADPAHRALYFHSAMEGTKIDFLRKNPAVSVNAVSVAVNVPRQLTTGYRSANAQGRAALVTDREEKLRALRLLTATFAPEKLATLDEYMAGEGCPDHTQIVRIDVEELTGKENKYGLEDVKHE